MPNWYFGTDNSGNLMSRDNIRGLWERVRSRGPCMLVTGDGSIDCQSNPNEQELIVAQVSLLVSLQRARLAHTGRTTLHRTAHLHTASLL
jgi:cap2 methyltransferase